MNKAEAPTKAEPMPILAMLSGSRRRRACHAQSATKGGTAMMLAKASTELNQDAGTEPTGVARLTWASMKTMPMFQIIG